MTAKELLTKFYNYIMDEHNGKLCEEQIHLFLKQRRSKTKEEVWSEIMSAIENWTPDSDGIIRNTSSEWMIKHDIENKTTWLSYYRIWKIFDRQFNMNNYEEVQDFTTAMLLKDGNISPFTTQYSYM